MFIPEERKQSTPTPVLFMKQNALVFPPLKSSFRYSLSEIAGCSEQFSHSARIYACVCVCACTGVFVPGLSWYLGVVLRAILHLLSERSQEHGRDGSWQPGSFWALMVWVLHATWMRRGERLNKRQTGPKSAKTFVIFPGKDQTQSDIHPLRFRWTHTPLCSYVHVCVRPIPTAYVKLSVKGMSLLGTKYLFCVSVDVTHTLEFSLMERSFTWNQESWTWFYFSFKTDIRMFCSGNSFYAKPHTQSLSGLGPFPIQLHVVMDLLHQSSCHLVIFCLSFYNRRHSVFTCESPLV